MQISCGTPTDPDDDSAANDDDSVLPDDDSGGDDDDSGADDDSAAPLDPTTPLPTCGQGWEDSFAETSVQPPPNGSNTFVPASADTLLVLEESGNALRSGHAELSAALGLVVGVGLCRDEEEPGTAVFVPEPPGSGRALLAWRAAPTRDLALLAPHAWDDESSLVVALQAFRDLDARAVLSSGARRCSSQTPSPCNAVGLLCDGSLGVLPISDLSHTDGSDLLLWQRLLQEWHPGLMIVAIHTRAAAGASVGDGTLLPGDAPHVAAVQQAFMDRFPGAEIAVCNPGAGSPETTEHCGEDDVLARASHGAVACSDSIPQPFGGYLHLSVGPDLAASPEGIMEALAAAFPEP